MSRNWRAARIIMLVALFSVTSTVAASASTVHKKKALSLSQITWVGGATETFAAEVVAEAQGYFAQQGITSSTNNVNLGTPASWVATVLSGSAQFIESSAGIVPSVGGGAPIRAIAMDQVPYEESMYISATYAAAHNIPSANTTVAQVIKQFKALKGLHITVAVSTVAVPAIPQLVGVGKKYGITVGVNNSQTDIDILPVGGAANAEVAVEDGKADAADLSPPQPSIPVITLPGWKIPPAATMAGEYTTTTITMIQQHPDTVQAVVTALTQATEYIKTHPQKAYNDITPFFSLQGYPASLWASYWAAFTDSVWLEYPSKAAYQEDLFLINEAAPITGITVTVPYSLFAVPRFSANALHQLGLKVP